MSICEVWDEFYDSQESTDETKDDIDSDLSEDWGLMMSPREGYIASPRLTYDYSDKTAPGLSAQSIKQTQLAQTMSEPLVSTAFQDNCASQRQSYTFVDSFIPISRRTLSDNSSPQNRIVTIGVNKHRVQFSQYCLDTPLENLASWLAEGALNSENGVKRERLVNNIAFNGKIIPIRNSLGGCSCDVSKGTVGAKHSLGDLLGKSLDASTQGLAFFVGPVNGHLSYKMSVLDVDQINRARGSSICTEIKEEAEGSESAIESLSDTVVCTDTYV